MSGGARLVRLRTTALVDAPFAPAYQRVTGLTPAQDSHPALTEYGLTGLLGDTPVDADARAVSAWLPGDDAAKRLETLRRWQTAGVTFRFFFPERYHAPSAQARALFVGNDLGTPAHFLIKVQAHPQRLLDPRSDTPGSWLREPVLNRLPLAVWMMGPVVDIRVLDSRIRDARSLVVLLRHRHPARLSVLESTVSPELRQGGEPAISDRFEATGSDGFIRVTGIWQEALHAPRLEVHRGPLELVQRDLPRGFTSVFTAAAAALPRLSQQSRESYRLAAEYLSACRLIEARLKRG